MKNRYGPLLRLLHSCMDQSVTAALESMELTSAQGHILGYLKHGKSPRCPRDVEQAFGLSHPTVSGILSRLERKGFIRLRPDDRDRRSKRIELLPRAEECHELIHRTILENECRLVEGFTMEEQVLFRDFLCRALENLDCCLPESLCKEEQSK